MASNLDKYRSDLQKLLQLGSKMDIDLIYRQKTSNGKLSEDESKEAKKYDGTFEKEYQNFYTEAHAVIKQLIPDRLDEFEKLYKGEPRRKEIDLLTFTIQDWMNGVRAEVSTSTGKKRFEDFSAMYMRFVTQMKILEACEARFSSSLFDIKQMVQADLFDSELESAEELIKHGFYRAAGAIAGVVVEKHLAQVADNHSLSIRKKAPTISDLNDALKSDSVVEIPTWRFIQRLADLRNLCDHNKGKEPSKDDAQELVAGAAKIAKTLF